MQNFTTSHNATESQPVQNSGPIFSSTIEAPSAAPDLCERLDAISVNSDCLEYLAAIKALATATADERHAVSIWCDAAIAELDAEFDI